jgi:hypothetical protein
MKIIKDKYGKYYINDNNKFHRTDGPAIEYVNGDKEWYINGMCHREDGPAVERYEDQIIGYWLNGNFYKNINSNEEWQKLVMKILLLG